MGFNSAFNPLNAKLNPICHLLALLGAHHIFHVSKVRVKVLRMEFILITLSIPFQIINLVFTDFCCKQF